MKYFFYIILFFLSKTTVAQMPFGILHSSTCVGSTIIFDSNLFEVAPFPNQVLWNFGDPSSGLLNTANGIQQPTHSFNTTGTYIITLKVVDAGAGNITITDTINIVTPVAYNFGADIFLCGDTAVYTLTAPTVAGAKYLWNDDSATTKPILTVTKTGNYTVQINGCEVTDTVGIFFSREATLDLGKDHVICAGENVSLIAANENASYEWKLNGAVMNFTQSQLPLVAPGGQYIANIDVPGCGKYTDTVNITFSNTPAAAFNLGPDTLLCPKQIFTLTANVSGASGYVWNSKGLYTLDAVNYNIGNDANLQVSKSGRYWAFVKIANQCEIVDTVFVKYRGNKELNFNDTAICQGTTLLLDADFGTGEYKWDAIPKQRNDQNNTNQSTYYVYSPGLFTVTAKVGQCIFTDSLRVQINDSLKISLGKDTTLCTGEMYSIIPTANTLDYKWQDSTTTTTYTPTKTGVYKIVAVNGCGKDTAQVKITFNNCPCALLLPNAFTPNGDGLNDVFKPIHACDMENFSMIIYNRYGELVFSSNNPLQGWDAKIKGKTLNQGNYVWSVKYTKPSTREVIQKQGSVLILR
jgi:gliding motility-associated-like protein